MKIRNDFVTNSSSSSFILAFSSKDEGIDTISRLTTEYGSKYVDQLLVDFSNALSFQLQEIDSRYRQEFEADAEWDLDYSCSWGRKPSFRDKWYESHPDAKEGDYYQSTERQERIQQYIDNCFKLLLEDIGDKEYLVELKYSDDTRIGSKLEHTILPELPFVVHTFSHH